MNKLTCAAASLIVLLAGGCASVTVRKVPSPAQYVVNGKSEWTLKDQRAADAIEGIRFYLPRPYVSVFESFPVATDVYLATGRVSPDGKYIAIDAIAPMSTRGDIAAPSATKVNEGLSIPQKWTFSKSAAPSSGAKAPGVGSMRSGPADGGAADGLTDKALGALAEIHDARKEALDATAAANDAAIDSRRAAAEAAKASGAGAGDAGGKTGQNKRAVTNSNGAFAYQPLRGSFDLVYLPDFDEQYVVSSKAGLGNAEFQLNLGQGWSMQGFNSLSDNSELNKRIFDVIDAGIAAAKKGAGAALAGLFPPAGAASLIAAPRSGEAAEEAPGTPVTLKIVVVHYAAKGLYPVIKPRELMDRAAPGLTINLADNQGVVPISDTMVANAVDQFDRLQRRSTVPVYPYQYISFNTFRYMAIEVLTPAGAPFGNLYDKSGTTGDAGAARQTDEALIKLLRDLKDLSAGSNTSGQPAAPAPKLSDFEATALAAANDSREAGVPEFKKATLDVIGTEKNGIGVMLSPDPGASVTDAIRTAIEGRILAALKKEPKIKDLLQGKEPARVDVGFASASGSGH